MKMLASCYIEKSACKLSKQKHMHSLPTYAYTQNKYQIRWGGRREEHVAALQRRREDSPSRRMGTKLLHDKIVEIVEILKLC